MKRMTKMIAARLCLISTWPLAFLVKVTGSVPLFAAFGQGLALIPGVLGSYIRVGYLRQTLDHASSSCRVGFGTYFAHRRASIGNGVYIGAYCIIGMVEIGENTMIASRVSVLSGRRQHSFEEKDTLDQGHGGSFVQVKIGANCWIGEGSVVMASLGERCVVGAGSIITKDYGDRIVLAGNPARVMREVDNG